MGVQCSSCQVAGGCCCESQTVGHLWAMGFGASRVQGQGNIGLQLEGGSKRCRQIHTPSILA